MKKFKITFEHEVIMTYEAEIEAEDKLEATKLFDEDPFKYVKGEAIDEQGNSIDIIGIEKI